MFIEQMTP